MLAENVIDGIGLVAAVALPFFNIPLIFKIIKRRSSRDISLCWALGVWVCILLMAPSGFKSADVVLRTFNYLNITMFTCVVIVALKYRHGRGQGSS